MPVFNSGEAYWYTKEQLQDEIRKNTIEKWPNILTDYDLYVIDKHLKRILGLTDRYQLEVDHTFRSALKDFFVINLVRLKGFCGRIFAKLSRML